MLYGWKFDAYKLSRCMCLSNYNRFWDRARYWSKIVIFIYPLTFDTRLGWFPSEYRHPVWCGETRMACYQIVKKFRRYLYSFWRNSRTWQTDRRTDGRTDGQTPRAGNSRAMHSIARQKPKFKSRQVFLIENSMFNWNVLLYVLLSFSNDVLNIHLGRINPNEYVCS